MSPSKSGKTASDEVPPVVDLRAIDAAVSAGSARPERRLAAFCRTIVQVATANPSVETVRTPVPCRRRPGGKPCPGRLVVRRQDIPPEAHWSCPACGDSGMVVGWRGTLWDYSARRPERDPAEPVETADVLLTEEEWRFLREQVITNGPDVDRMIAAVQLTDRGVLLTGTLDDLDDLAGSVAFEANHTRRRRDRRLCEAILDRLDEAIGQGVPPGPSLELFQAAAAGAVATYNRTPQPELRGLSPEQAFRLMESSWEGPESAVAIDSSLPLSALERSLLLVNARLFVDVLAEEGGTKATTAGNLNRAFVGRMFESMTLPPLDREVLSRIPRRMNEEDLWPLHLLRLLLDLTGLVKRRKGFFRVTKAGERLCAEERAGELYAHLFVALFRRLNLAYLDRFGPAAASLQYTIAFCLLRFSRVGGTWRTVEELVDDLVLPRVLKEIPSAGDFFDLRAHILETRLLKPLESFALAEREGWNGLELSREALAAPVRYRKTDLYDRFLTFRV